MVPNRQKSTQKPSEKSSKHSIKQILDRAAKGLEKEASQNFFKISFHADMVI